MLDRHRSADEQSSGLAFGQRSLGERVPAELNMLAQTSSRFNGYASAMANLASEKPASSFSYYHKVQASAQAATPGTFSTAAQPGPLPVKFESKANPKKRTLSLKGEEAKASGSSDDRPEKKR
jgi:hypothetical protein